MVLACRCIVGEIHPLPLNYAQTLQVPISGNRNPSIISVTATGYGTYHYPQDWPLDTLLRHQPLLGEGGLFVVQPKDRPPLDPKAKLVKLNQFVLTQAVQTHQHMGISYGEP